MSRKYKNLSFLPDGLPAEEDILKGIIIKLHRSAILLAPYAAKRNAGSVIKTKNWGFGGIFAFFAKIITKPI